MNRQKELGRIRFMLGEHAEVLDRACSPMEILEAANAAGYRWDQNDDAAWEFLRPKIKAAVAAFDLIRTTDRRAIAYGEWCNKRNCGVAHAA